MDAFLAIFGNGPVETGLSAGIEKYVQAEHGAIKARTIKGTYGRNLFAFRAAGYADNNFTKAAAGAAALAFTGRYGAIANWSSAEEQDAGADDEIPNDEIKSAIQNAVALIVATKVNWWKGNHHTGGRIAIGFVARAFSVINGPGAPIDEQITKLAWRVGHWFDTRIWLASLGVKGILVDPRAIFEIEVDDAVYKRICSAPAGAAGFEAVFAGLKYVASHPVLCAANAPALLDWKEWVACHASIQRNPARFHIGSLYLTGKDQIALPAVPDPVISFVATCIRFANRDATLLKAAVFKNVADDATTFNAIRAASEFSKVERRAVGVAQWINAVSSSKSKQKDDDEDDSADEEEPEAIEGGPEGADAAEEPNPRVE